MKEDCEEAVKRTDKTEGYMYALRCRGERGRTNGHRDALRRTNDRRQDEHYVLVDGEVRGEGRKRGFSAQ